MNFACWMLLWSVISESTSCQITNVKCLIASASSANKMQNLDLIWDLSVAWLIYHETLLTTYSMENWTYQGLSSTSGLKKGLYKVKHGVCELLGIMKCSLSAGFSLSKGSLLCHNWVGKKSCANFQWKCRHLFIF